MKRKALFALIALTLGGATVAQAQSWYIAPRVGAVFSDTDRQTDTSLYSGIGAGVWVNPNLAIDFEYGINNADFEDSSFRAGHEFESVTLGVSGRWFFGEQGAKWRPYVMAGLGAQRHQAYSGFYQHNGWDPMATAGGGIQFNISEKVAIRGELAARYDHDNNTFRGQYVGAPDVNHFVDGIATVGLVYNFGAAAAPAPPPPAEPAPPPPPPPAVEPEPTKVVIDLRGVNFKFDRPKSGEKNISPTLQVPTADSIAILDQAVEVLQRNPDVKVELDGHTDSVGSDAYNQKLSERRAQIVHDYLVAHGVNASQITNVVGFGESKPIDTNATKEGRARNRRTELQVQ